MKFPRNSGILLHPSSFPGRFGIGELNAEAYEFVEFLAAAGQRLWQVLPLGPTGYGDSPYQCFSAFAGNPLLIDPEQLVEDGLLSSSDLESTPSFPETVVDYGPVIGFKYPVLHKAYENYLAGASTLGDEFREFCQRQAWWLDDYALYAALKDAHGGKAWTRWEQGVARREPEAMAGWREKLADEVEAIQFWQFLFFRQWEAVRSYVHERGIKIVGDIPIYVAHDSADVWAHPEVFHLDEKGDPTVVAGVPPDYFSKTGQLWGNPIYRWRELAETGYQWWIDRFRHVLTQVDIVRLDHFRGFQAYWQVLASEETAINGEWIKGPGAGFFHALQAALGSLPVIAENLGLITPEVEALRTQFGFPGMVIMQFAFSPDRKSTYLPHHYISNTVAYSGTHDNDTTVGWWQSDGSGGSTRSNKQIREEKEFARLYLNTDGEEIHWDFIRALSASVANTVIFPVQDILGLGGDSRMNLPGRPDKNWQWRYTSDSLSDSVGERLKELTEVYGRAPEAQELSFGGNT